MSHSRILRRSVAQWLLAAALINLWAFGGAERVGGEELTFLRVREFTAQDTLDVGQEASADARECLDGLTWKNSRFPVHCEEPAERRGDALVRFPSPISTKDPVNDLVAMEWYLARDERRQPIVAPAVVVVHESGSEMTVGRLIAWSLQQQGLHTFLLHLPRYGERRKNKERIDPGNLVPVIRQAVADVRRARDAVAALPYVDESRIALQGTSLGGFVAATSASLDHGYSSVFLLLAGGNLLEIIENGAKDAAKIRDKLAERGLTGEKLAAVLRTIEPTRVAHRLEPDRTWLYSGLYDTVVPPKNADDLAKAARLPENHHLRLLANHYSGIVFLPIVMRGIHDRVHARPREQKAAVLPE